MSLPADLFQAISSPGGGKIALVLGAGCSVEPPTSIPVTQVCSARIHHGLVTDGVLEAGDCSNPNDLSILVDVVFDKKQSQRDVAERLRDQYDLRRATPNEGYLLAAAMLGEGAIGSVVTLNFDLALSNALSLLGLGHLVGVIERPGDLPTQKTINVYYLHQSANTDPEEWVLRTAALNESWNTTWKGIIATRVLATPVVVFVGLGTPVKVLIESAKLLREALRGTTRLYQVDPAAIADSAFFRALELDAAAYIRRGWSSFMEELSQRLLAEQLAELEQAINLKVQEDRLQPENVTDLLVRLGVLGLIEFGKLRAYWLLHDKPYCCVALGPLGLFADLFLALAMITRVSGADAVLANDGVVEFHRDGRVVAAYLIASGRGFRARTAVEGDVQLRRRQYRSRHVQVSGVLVAGTADGAAPLTVPLDVLRGDASDDIVDPTGPLNLLHVSTLRTHPDQIAQVVP